MTKLMNLDLQNAEILDKKGMKEVTGGIGFECPPGLVYNPAIDLCDLPGNVDEGEDLRQKNISACEHAVVRDPSTGQVSNCYAYPCTFTSSNGTTRTGECRLIPFANPKECICFGTL